jgi:DNA modification methylase
MRLLLGDSLHVLQSLPAESIDSVVTDPPYGLAFMGKRWDYDVPSVDLWREVFRVLKPGGHLLAFAGTRTQHRMCVNIEDAGFEIRDMIAWVYGSGFPKSLDVSKAIDRQRHDQAQVYRVTEWIRRTRDAANVTNREIDLAFGFNGMAGHWTSSGSQPSVPTIEQIPPLLQILGVTLSDVPDDIRELIYTLNTPKGQPGKAWQEREVVGSDTKARSTAGKSALPMMGATTVYETWDITAPATEAAKQWEGWGTALKPALEPITVARKPLIGTVAANVQQFGTGAINVDGCRVGSVSGRWPANLIHDGSDEVVRMFPAAEKGRARMKGTMGRSPFSEIEGSGRNESSNSLRGHNDNGGSAARFFYCAKASQAERSAGLKHREPATVSDGRTAPNDTAYQRDQTPRRNIHPTVKPIALMRYLVRLVTPPGSTVLDPFMGSGTTGIAAALEGFDFVGIEREPEYLEIAQARIAHWSQRPANRPAKKAPDVLPGQLSLFGGGS